MVLQKVKDLVRRRPRQLSLEEYLAKLSAKGLNQDGTFMVDPTPMAPPIGYKKHPSMVEIVRDMVRSEKLRVAALESGHESFEEAEDFDVDDEPQQLRSKYENEQDPTLKDLLAAGAHESAARKAKERKEAGDPPADDVSPPEPRPSPKRGRGTGGGSEPPGERSDDQ